MTRKTKANSFLWMSETGGQFVGLVTGREGVRRVRCFRGNTEVFRCVPPKYSSR